MEQPTKQKAQAVCSEHLTARDMFDSCGPGRTCHSPAKGEYEGRPVCLRHLKMHEKRASERKAAEEARAANAARREVAEKACAELGFGRPAFASGGYTGGITLTAEETAKLLSKNGW